MPIEVEIMFYDETTKSEIIENDEQNQIFSFIFSKKPDGMLFDKFEKIPLKQVSIKETKF